MAAPGAGIATATAPTVPSEDGRHRVRGLYCTDASADGGPASPQAGMV